MTTVATFNIEYTQYLNENAETTQDLPSFAQDPNNLIPLYRQMVILRAYDTKAIALQRTGKMGTYASTLGQEAISTAIGAVMKTEDVHAPYYRDYGTQLQRGIKMSEIYNYWGGDERGNCYQNNKEDMPMSVPIGSQTLHAAGIATAFKIRQQKRVVVATIGDGGTSEGDFYEAINVAGAWQLPVVFVINNNQWAISVPLAKQTHCQTIAQKAIAAGIPGEQVDGNDIIAVHEVTQQAIEKARNGGGPSVIEALSYRLCDHTTADDATRYRSKEEVDKAWRQEPIVRLRNYLNNIGAWSEQDEKQLQQEAAKLVDEAVNEYLSIEAPTLESIFDYHYENMPQSLAEQRAQALEEARHA